MVKNMLANAGDMGLIPGLGRFSGERIGYLLQYSWISLAAQLVKNPPAMRETISGGSKITAGDCSHEIKRHLLLGRKAMTNLGSILKSKDITLPTKVHLVKAMVFPVVMYRCESWIIKKAEC